MSSKNVTVTDARLLEALKIGTAKSIGVQPDVMSKNIANNLQLIKCKVLRWYNTRQEVYVEILSTKKKVQAKILNPFLSQEVNINFTPDGVFHNDKKGYYIVPHEKLYGCILEFKNKTKKGNDYCFMGFMDNNTMNLNSNAIKGEVLIKTGENYISITEERINIVAENFFVNGLPFDEPDLQNYYTKSEIDELIKKLHPNEEEV